VVGSIGVDSPQKVFNSATVVSPTGDWDGRYSKIHLVPFGEYVPFASVFSFASGLTQAVGNFTPGTSHAPLHAGNQELGIFICYESIFPNEVRQLVAQGAQVLVNISNDGWFGRSAAPAQHLMMSRVRAIESRRWMLRGTNNGFTVSVDPYGRIVARLPTDIRGELEAPYDFRSDLTPYVRFGDWLCWLCLFTSLLILGMAFARPTQRLQR